MAVPLVPLSCALHTIQEEKGPLQSSFVSQSLEKGVEVAARCYVYQRLEDKCGLINDPLWLLYQCNKFQVSDSESNSQTGCISIWKSYFA